MNTRAKIASIKGLFTKRSPIYAQFALSKNCNLSCRMCRAVESRKGEIELDVRQIEHLAQVLDTLGVGTIVLTGGEPLLRKDLPEVVALFSRRGMEVRLQTNGLLATEESILALVAAGLSEVTLSLDTLDPQKQDNINNKAGSWDKTIRAIALFSRLLPVRGNVSGINTVVSRLNIREIPDIVKFVSGLGFYSSLIPVHLSGKDDGDFILRTPGDEFRFTESDRDLVHSVYQKIIAMKRKGYLVHNSFRFLRFSPEYLLGKRIDWPCDSPDLYFSISPGGKFLPCVDIKGEKSMLDDDFIEVFRSRGFRQDIRNAVKNCPGCFYACYSEITYFCRNPITTLERLWQGAKTAVYRRKPLSYEESLELVKKIKGNYHCRDRTVSCPYIGTGPL